MSADLATLLFVRLGVDGLVAVAFLANARRYPTIGGPRWWALSAGLSMLAALAALWRVAGAGPVAAVVAAMLMFSANASVWLGLRHHLKQPLPWTTLGAQGALWLLLHLVLLGGEPGVHQMIYAAAGMVLAILVARDLRRLDLRRAAPEFSLLFGLEVAEAALLAGVLAWLTITRTSVGTGVAFTLLFVLFLARLLRAMVCDALVSTRLRQLAERARLTLIEREADAQALVDNLAAAVIVFRPDRSLLRVNAAARRFLGWPVAGDHPKKLDWQLMRADGQRMARHELPFERVLASGQPVIELVLGVGTPTDDTVRWALCNAYPENDALGGLRHVVVTLVDITSLRQVQQQQRDLEQQLSQSQKMEALGTLAGGVAHDFNNILAAILGNAELAREDLPRDTPASQSLQEISNAARRGRELVRQILAYSRQQPLLRVPVCPLAIMDETCSLLRAALPPHVQLVRRAAPGCPAILGDATRLGQVLLNLGTNAVQALKGRTGCVEFLLDAVAADDPTVPRDVAVACMPTGVRAVRIAVRDNGCGMDEGTLRRIFEPFFTTKETGRGTGLGLAVVQGIVQAHGGVITVDSRPGEGTTFVMFFPGIHESVATVAGDGGTMSAHASGHESPDNHDSAEPPAMSDEPARSQRHILYLDDDDTLVFLVRRLLERRGYKVTGVCDQREAIEAVRSQPQAFDLLMTDYNMPGMSGIDVAREVLAINPKLPVAVASGYISDELQAEADATGVTEVVFKTDAVETFCEIVSRLVGTAPQPR